MGRFALVEYSLIRQLCQDLKREKNSFSGRLKDFENERKAGSKDKIEETRRLLLSRGNSDKTKSAKRKIKKKKVSSKEAKRFRQNDSFGRESSTSGSSTSSSEESDATEPEPEINDTTSESSEDLQ